MVGLGLGRKEGLTQREFRQGALRILDLAAYAFATRPVDSDRRSVYELKTMALFPRAKYVIQL